jgi:hypothetical protein
MAANPSAKPGNGPASAPQVRWYAKSKSYRFLVEGQYLWQSIGAATLGAAGVVALIVAIVKFSGVALAVALILLPFALIVWLSARSIRDAGRDW